MRVLIVEDEFLIALDLEDCLLAYGNEVHTAATVSEAMALLDAHDFDAASMDVNVRGNEQSFPVMDRLVEMGVPFVIVSGYVDLKCATGRRINAYGVPTHAKPLRAEALARLIQGFERKRVA